MLLKVKVFFPKQSNIIIKQMDLRQVFVLFVLCPVCNVEIAYVVVTVNLYAVGEI